MVLELSMIAGGLLKAVLPKVAVAIAQAISHKLNPTDLQRALEAGLEASEALKIGQQMKYPVFYRCDDKARDIFLAKFLEHSGTLWELQRPLKQAGNPSVEHLVQVAEQVAKQHKILIEQQHLKLWLEALVHGYFAKTDMFLQFQVAKQDYLRQLANWFDDVKFAGVAVEGQEIEKAEKLAQIFVMPDVREEERVIGVSTFLIIDALDEGIEQATTRLSDSFEGKPVELDRQTELLREQQQKALLSPSGRQFSAQQLLSQGSIQTVLLGAPGSGKTTLLSYFAVMLAQQQMEKLGLPAEANWLPILVRIRDWERCSNLSLPDYIGQFAEKTMSVKSLPQGFFQYWLENGRALILLDGLDEVADESRRYDIVQRIENFLGQYRHNHAIITSRPAGYKRDFFRTEEFPHYELQPFDDRRLQSLLVAGTVVAFQIQ
jgi:predicted NACHT family NTPase